MIIFLNSKCRPLSVYRTCCMILLYILHAELLVRQRERERERTKQRTNITKYVKEKLNTFLEKKIIGYIQRYIRHFEILMFMH